MLINIGQNQRWRSTCSPQTFMLNSIYIMFHSETCHITDAEKSQNVMTTVLIKQIITVEFVIWLLLQSWTLRIWNEHSGTLKVDVSSEHCMTFSLLLLGWGRRLRSVPPRGVWSRLECTCGVRLRGVCSQSIVCSPPDCLTLIIKRLSISGVSLRLQWRVIHPAERSEWWRSVYKPRVHTVSRWVEGNERRGLNNIWCMFV